MKLAPPSRRVPPSRGHIAGRQHAAIVGWVLACATVPLVGCRPPQESFAGLLVASAGSIERLDDDGTFRALAGSPSHVRQMATAGGTVVVLTDGGSFIASLPGQRTDPPWRRIDVDLPAGGFVAGIDVSPDGRSLAIVHARDDVDRLDLSVVEITSGAARETALDMAANGPPSWLSNDAIALEVIGGDDLGAVVSVPVGGGEPVFSQSRGFALASTAGGGAIAVADDATGTVVVRDPGAWWAGTSGDGGIETTAGHAVQDVAIDADGTRIGIVYTQPDEERWTISVYRLVGRDWQVASSIELDSHVPPTIDWLE